MRYIFKTFDTEGFSFDDSDNLFLFQHDHAADIIHLSIGFDLIDFVPRYCSFNGSEFTIVLLDGEFSEVISFVNEKYFKYYDTVEFERTDLDFDSLYDYDCFGNKYISTDR